jgi:A/G-specific adenine glycosylase
LLAWFDTHQRQLPWRANRDPYRIWVSEVMLQQTQVATVIPFFERFVSTFPTLHALAAADLADVLKHWEGLGYYRRAKHLHAAAQQLVRAHPAGIPNDPAYWAELPGVGPYILGAVLSQAFERRLPIVEANSQRVLARWIGERNDPRTGPAKQRLWQVATALLPTRRVGDFNQALMELGALVCTPTHPQCGACPVARWCVAHRDGTQAEIPPAKSAAVVEQVEEVAVVIHHAERVLLVQRPPTADRWASLWEFPHGPVSAGETVLTAGPRLARALVGLDVTLGQELGVVKHTVTRWQIRMVVLAAQSPSAAFASAFYTAGQWVRLAELAQFPVSAPQRQIADWLTAEERQPRLF